MKWARRTKRVLNVAFAIFATLWIVAGIAAVVWSLSHVPTPESVP